MGGIFASAPVLCSFLARRDVIQIKINCLCVGLLSVEKPSSCLLDALQEQIPCTREMFVNLLLFGLCLVLHLLLNPGRILRGHLVRPPPAAAINLDTTNSCVTPINSSMPCRIPLALSIFFYAKAGKHSTFPATRWSDLYFTYLRSRLSIN